MLLEAVQQVERRRGNARDQADLLLQMLPSLTGKSRDEVLQQIRQLLQEVDRLKVSFLSTAANIRTYVRCGVPVHGGCIFPLDPTTYSYVAGSNRGGSANISSGSS